MLKQAGRKWYVALHRMLSELGFCVGNADPLVFHVRTLLYVCSRSVVSFGRTGDDENRNCQFESESERIDASCFLIPTCYNVYPWPTLIVWITYTSPGVYCRTTIFSLTLTDYVFVTLANAPKKVLRALYACDLLTSTAHEAY
jgi:hypothetical protein